MLKIVYWDAGTAGLLPRGPVFVTHRRPGPGKVVSPRDLCPDTGPARLSYGRAGALLDELSSSFTTENATSRCASCSASRATRDARTSS